MLFFTERRATPCAPGDSRYDVTQMDEFLHLDKSNMYCKKRKMKKNVQKCMRINRKTNGVFPSHIVESIKTKSTNILPTPTTVDD